MEVRSIILFGFMGTGKTTIAAVLAERLSWNLFDMDELIEQKEQKNIPEIFKIKGEEYFRGLERDLVIDLCRQKDAVIATGGGVVQNPDNIKDFHQAGLCVCLFEDLDVIYQRVKDNNKRPLIRGDDSLEALSRLWKKRKKLYRQIDVQMNCQNKSVDEVVDEILKLKNEREKLGQAGG